MYSFAQQAAVEEVHLHRSTGVFEMSLPSVNLGYWMPLLAVVAHIGVYAYFAGNLFLRPKELLESYGFKGIADAPFWAVLVNMGRVVAVQISVITGMFVYFLIGALNHGWFSSTSIFLPFLFSSAILAQSAYRAFAEDPKSKNNSADSVAAQKKDMLVFGVLVILCLLGGLCNYLFAPADGYITDAYHGLPEELSLARENMARKLGGFGSAAKVDSQPPSFLQHEK